MKIIDPSGYVLAQDLEEEYKKKFPRAYFEEIFQRYQLHNPEGFDTEDILKGCEQSLRTIYGESQGHLSQLCMLDLGCGSKKAIENRFYGNYEPWLARVLFDQGVEIIGVDIQSLEGELFKNYQIDLEKESLDFLGENTFDIVHTSMLYTSPQRETESEYRSREGIRDHVRALAKKLLKEQGLFIEYG